MVSVCWGRCWVARCDIEIQFFFMANCPNCGAKLSCGCQRKTASDGKQGCVQCIPAYEKQLKERNKKIIKH